MNIIQITKLGESLVPYPGNHEFNKDAKLSTCVGIHTVCCGFVDIMPVSSTYNVLLCRHCHLRLPIPKSVETYGQLAEHCRRNELTASQAIRSAMEATGADAILVAKKKTDGVL